MYVYKIYVYNIYCSVVMSINEKNLVRNNFLYSNTLDPNIDSKEYQE